MIYVLVIILLILAVWFFRREAKTVKTPPYALPNLLPDRAVSFGYKCAWLAIRTTDMEAVINQLGLKNCEPCSWESGITRANKYPDGEVFVTPPVKGFVFCVSFTLPEFPTGSLPDNLTPLLERMASAFDEVQYFFTYRVAEGHAWAVYKGGTKVRSFGFFDGEVQWESGEPTDVEKERDWEFDDEDDLKLPDEEDVMAVAASWSVNPSELESMNLPTTQGIIGRR